MSAVADFIDQELRWVQPHALGKDYELRAGDRRLASLSFRSLFGSFATGEIDGGSWTFKRIGFLQTRVTIRRRDTDADIAVFRNNTWSSGGTLELPDGRRYRASTNFWQTRLDFTTEQDELLLRFETSGLLKLGARLTIDPRAAALAELPWIILLGWYLIVMMQSDAGGTAAAAAAG